MENEPKVLFHLHAKSEVVDGEVKCSQFVDRFNVPFRLHKLYDLLGDNDAFCIPSTAIDIEDISIDIGIKSSKDNSLNGMYISIYGSNWVYGNVDMYMERLKNSMIDRLSSMVGSANMLRSQLIESQD